MEKKKLQELCKSLSVDEKIQQLLQLSSAFYGGEGIETGPLENMGIDESVVYNSGSILNIFGVDRLNSIQDDHIKHSSNKIPMMVMADIIHGYKTIMPIPLAQGCSFNPKLAEEGASVAAKEASASGVHITFSPMVDLVRDPRWGRVMESTGEDPYLNAQFSAAIVKGYQGEDLSHEGTIGACVKHFAAYGAPEGGREYNTVDISERSLFQDYLPSYKAAVDAGVAMAMTSFNSVGGVPSTANKKLCRNLLREEWGFDGVIITDWGSINTLINHGVAKDKKDAAKLGIEASVDIEMCTSCYIKHLKELIEEGTVPMQLLDNAVMRVLTLKNQLGLFENTHRFADAKKAEQLIRCKEHLAVSRKFACESSVLLKNEDNLLPLCKKEKIAFIGPYTEEYRINGAWSVVDKNEDCPSLMKVITDRYPDAEFTFTLGSRLLGCEAQSEAEVLNYTIDDTNREAYLCEAEEAAKKANIVVLCIGEHYEQSGEAKSRSEITIPVVQMELFRRVHAVNQNIAVVLFNGRPLDIREVKDKAKAILDVWFPGTEGMQAIADMLFGDTAPSGRLCMTFPYSVGQIPTYYNHLNTDHPYTVNGRYSSRYIDISNDPLYPFGYGLSYTTFEYSDFIIDKEVLTPGSKITASVKVKNTGSCRGAETVQMYLRDMVASVTRPLKELKGFYKIWLEPGQEAEISFDITEDMLKLYDINMDYVSEAGDFRVFIGADSTVNVYRIFTLVK